MGKRRKRNLKIDPAEEVSSRLSEPVITLSSSDEEEANEDLSLRIVEKATRLHGEMRNQMDFVFLSSDDGGSVVDFSLPSTSEAKEKVETDDDHHANRSKKKERSKRSTTVADLEDEVGDVEIDKNAEDIEGIQRDKLEESKDVEKSGNVLLKKLLRGPRYFDPPEGGWETCYNCGEAGHISVNCALVKRKKPCFLCGSLDHSFKNCKKGRNCFICKRSGHHPRQCPDKDKHGSVEAKICLNCGDSGHDMFSCRNGYSREDLKEIRCYTCNGHGHLCCGKFVDNGPIEDSCYQCGRLGHNGPECTRSLVEAAGSGSISCCFRCGDEGHFARDCMEVSRDLFTDSNSHSLCYNCGQDGHFARECTKVVKRSIHLSVSSKRVKSMVGARSLPHNLDRKKKAHYEGRHGTGSPKAKAGRGWITEHPGDFDHPYRIKQGGWKSPTFSYSHSPESSYFHTPKRKHIRYLATPSTHSSSKDVPRGFSASSRFCNSGGKPRRTGVWR